MVLLWRKGVRVLTAGSIQVKRDRRIALRGTDLQITGVDRNKEFSRTWKAAASLFAQDKKKRAELCV